MDKDALFQQFVDRINTLIVTGQQLGQGQYAGFGSGGVPFPHDLYTEWRTESLHLLRQFFGETSLHTQELTREFALRRTDDEFHIRPAVGILRAALKDGSWDRFTSVRALISAEHFANFLDAAQHQLDAGYRVPAAVIAGSVLEQHTRRLAAAHGIAVTRIKNGDTVPESTETINQGLVKAQAYNSIKQKQVTSWLGIRNSAAHGEGDRFTDADVAAMIRDVTRFIDEHPA